MAAGSRGLPRERCGGISALHQEDRCQGKLRCRLVHRQELVRHRGNDNAHRRCDISQRWEMIYCWYISGIEPQEVPHRPGVPVHRRDGIDD
ncbi:hypothetical protein NDU88_010107 [Pleurodeles waltl]|uniref:Uncharacterized protein n=1 Tax=Pleurodeles waltl TaxID=8319 RepID=A0AAV7PV00_PLEWA|nr:hypothetical protein NDU88_010107 [Pleurodeles waltl]